MRNQIATNQVVIAYKYMINKYLID